VQARRRLVGEVGSDGVEVLQRRQKGVAVHKVSATNLRVYQQGLAHSLASNPCWWHTRRKAANVVPAPPKLNVTMVLQKTLSRSLKAQDDDSDEEQYSEGSRGSSPSILDTADGGDIASSVSDDADATAIAQLSKVSFGSLAKAQDEILKQGGGSRKRKRGSDVADGQESQLQALRERLRELKAQKSNSKTTPGHQRKSLREKDEDNEDSDSDSSSSDQPARARSSKHAPAIQSSKRTVTRNRQVIEVKKPVYRDPRFDPLTGPKPDDSKLKKRYGFLDDYKASEMAEMRATIKKTKNAEEKEELKRKLLAMENQVKAQKAKDERQEVVSQHRKKEKELVKDGKKPYFLKKCKLQSRMLFWLP
jgi:ribosomal RNA-processing protein 36